MLLTKPLNVTLIDDCEEDAFIVKSLLKGATIQERPIKLCHSDKGSDIDFEEVDVLLLDYNLKGFDRGWKDIIEDAKAASSPPIVITLSGHHHTFIKAVRSLCEGAMFLSKDHLTDRDSDVILNTIELGLIKAYN